jgi:hypothetical protein
MTMTMAPAPTTLHAPTTAHPTPQPSPPRRSITEVLNANDAYDAGTGAIEFDSFGDSR